MRNDAGSAGPLSIGIEIGGTKTQVGIGSARDGLLPDGILRRPVRRELGAPGVLDDLVSMVNELLTARRLTLADIEKVGIGYGGILESSSGVVLRSFQIDGWTNFPLRDWAKKQWGKPVTLENDAGTAGFAEYVLGHGRGCSRLFYITVGSGVGGGWIVNGRIDNGQGIGAAEIGHMWVPDPQSGRLTELEQVCSGWAIAQRARLAESRARSLMGEIAGSMERIDAKVVYAAAEKGDQSALRVLDETCLTLGTTISNIVALLHPERVIVGGGVSLMGPVFWNRLQRQFRLRVLPTFAPQVELLPATLKEDVVVVGAICLGSVDLS